jgi:D-alanyl-D-alanine carboxypeptidase
MQSILDTFLADHPFVPGVIARVETASGKTWMGAAGLADTGAGTPMQPEMTFRIASNTKTFTAAAMLRLVEQGHASLDDVLLRYFPATMVDRLNVIDGVSRGREITLRQMLNHSSGMYDWGIDDAYARIGADQPAKRWTPMEQVEFALAHGAPYNPPGDGFHYSDTPFVLVSMIIEQLTGLPLAEAFRSVLGFDRLGMGSTYLESLEPVPPTAGQRVHQYIGRRDGNDIDASFDLFGGGGLISSAADLARFWGALFSGEVFESPSTLKAMLTTVPAGDRGESGLGIFRRQFDGTRAWSHSGFWGSFALHVPETGVMVTGVANQQQAQGGALLELVTSLLAAAGAN